MCGEEREHAPLLNASSRTGTGGHEAELVGARVKASRKEWFIMYGMADLKNCLPKDVVISVRVYKSSRETGQALVKVEYFIEKTLSPMKFSQLNMATGWESMKLQQGRQHHM